VPLVPLTEAGQAAALRLLGQGAPVLEWPVLDVTAAKAAQGAGREATTRSVCE
jgi:hypothetical protein